MVSRPACLAAARNRKRFHFPSDSPLLIPDPLGSPLPKTFVKLRWGLGFPSASSLHRRLRSALRSTRTVDRVFSKSNHIWISRRARGDKERADQHRTCSWAAASRLAPSSPSATSLSVGHQRIGAVPVRSFTPHQGFDTVCASFLFWCQRHCNSKIGAPTSPSTTSLNRTVSASFPQRQKPCCLNPFFCM